MYESVGCFSFFCNIAHQTQFIKFKIMKRLAYIFIFLLVCLPSMLYGQENKYLAGAVPEVDGKVVFSKEFSLPGISKEAIYNRMHEWLTDRMKANNNASRIVFEEPSREVLAAVGEEYLVFSSSALSLDRASMSYQVSVTCSTGKCLVEFGKIRYAYQNERYSAEEYITDAVALNKAKTNIYRGYRKFRTNTIDFADKLFSDVGIALGINSLAVVAQPAYQPLQPVATAPAVETPVITAAPAPTPTVKPDVSAIPVLTEVPTTSKSVDLQGYKRIAPDKIPGNIIKMLSEDWMLITAGNEEKFNMMTASWGGLGVLYGKPVTTCFINPTRYTYQLMEKNDTYTLTFYTEAYRNALQYSGTTSGKDGDKIKGSGLTPITTPEGSKAFGEAWLIIECRKLVSQSLMPEAIADQKIKEEWVGKQLHKMFIGEIINVWVK